MFSVGRTVFVLIAALIAVKPLMACCLDGGLAAASPMTASHAPPCHGEPDGAEQRHCTSCCDCDAALVSSTDRLAPLVSLVADQFQLIAVDSQIVPPFQQRVLPLKTGPPDAPPRNPSTPAPLKQRLLI